VNIRTIGIGSVLGLLWLVVLTTPAVAETVDQHKKLPTEGIQTIELLDKRTTSGIILNSDLDLRFRVKQDRE
jgi:hypothetical protein